MEDNHRNKTKIFSVQLNNLISFMTSWHKLHGVLVLADDPNQSRASKSWGVLIKTMMLICSLCLLLGGLPWFTTNDKFQRFTCIDCVSMHLLIFIQTLVLWIKRSEVHNFVEWCHQIEMQPQLYCKKPREWFTATRKDVFKMNS